MNEPTFQAELDLLFVEPAALGIGVGRQLFGWACQRARRLGASSLVILSDPSARGFYESQSAQYLRLAPSDVIRSSLAAFVHAPV